MYRKLREEGAAGAGGAAVASFLPELRSSKPSTGRRCENGLFLPTLSRAFSRLLAPAHRVIIELEDLTHGLQAPCLMDVKMGARTFTDADAESTSMRPDLLAKLDKVDPEQATEEERAAGGMTKMRYLVARDLTTSTHTLGFRVDAVQLSERCGASTAP